jgi:ATP-dependent Clp protease, protease subunit
MTPTPDWLQERLFERRIVFVTGRLDDVLAAHVAAQIVALDAAGDEPIDVVLNSSDGTLEATFALMDVIDGARATVRLQCQGRVMGPAIGLTAAADHRSAAPHTTFRLSAPGTSFSGSPEQLVTQSRQHRELLWRLQARLAHTTGRGVEDIADAMCEGRYLHAAAALEYGLIDEIRS